MCSPTKQSEERDWVKANSPALPEGKSNARTIGWSEIAAKAPRFSARIIADASRIVLRHHCVAAFEMGTSVGKFYLRHRLEVWLVLQALPVSTPLKT